MMLQQGVTAEYETFLVADTPTAKRLDLYAALGARYSDFGQRVEQFIGSERQTHGRQTSAPVGQVGALALDIVQQPEPVADQNQAFRRGQIAQRIITVVAENIVLEHKSLTFLSTIGGGALQAALRLLRVAGAVLLGMLLKELAAVSECGAVRESLPRA